MRLLRIREVIAKAKAGRMSRAAAGSRAHKAGDAFEAWLSGYVFTPLKVAGVIARFDKLEPRMRPVRTGGACYFQPVAGSGGDWLLLGSKGRYIVVESKSTTAERYYYESIPAQQVEHLNTSRANGGGAFLALQFKQERFLIPWGAVPWERARTAYSVRPALLGQWAVRGWQDARNIIEGA